MRKELEDKKKGELHGMMDEVSHVNHASGDGDDDDGGATVLSGDGDGDGDGAASPTPAPGWECPADELVDNTTGQEIAIPDTNGFVEYFNLSFKVKINDFDTPLAGYQVLMTSDEDAFVIEATGPKYCDVGTDGVTPDCLLNKNTNYKDRIMAYINTEAQEAAWPCHSCHNTLPCTECGSRGIIGTTGYRGGHGYLFSQKLTAGEWYDVILTKNKTHLILTVDGQEHVAENKVSWYGPHAFDTNHNSTKILAGTETGDIGPDGSICKVELNTTVPEEHVWTPSTAADTFAPTEAPTEAPTAATTAAAT